MGIIKKMKILKLSHLKILQGLLNFSMLQLIPMFSNNRETKRRAKKPNILLLKLGYTISQQATQKA